MTPFQRALLANPALRALHAQATGFGHEGIERAVAKKGERLPQAVYSQRALYIKRNVEAVEIAFGLRAGGTPPRRRKNILGGLTRGERKEAMRNLTITMIETGRTFKGKNAIPVEDVA